MARSKRSAEKEKFWRRVVAEQRRGGLKIREFCQQKSLSEASFHSWRRELRKRDAERAADADGKGRLIPVAVVDAMRENASSMNGWSPWSLTSRTTRYPGHPPQALTPWLSPYGTLPGATTTTFACTFKAAARSGRRRIGLNAGGLTPRAPECSSLTKRP